MTNTVLICVNLGVWDLNYCLTTHCFDLHSLVLTNPDEAMCLVSLLTRSATVQLTASSVNICLSLTNVNCFHAEWNETVLHSLNLWVSCVSKKWPCFVENKLPCMFYCMRLFYNCYIISPWNQIIALHSSYFYWPHVVTNILMPL
jgi:hypothetical protein